MNDLENKMVESLINLRDKHGVIEVKAEFEAEASRMNELMRLKEVADKAGLGLVLKVGGAEAITDMFEAIGKYFPQDLRKTIHFGVNIETYQAYKNLEEMLNLQKIHFIDTITLKS